MVRDLKGLDLGLEGAIILQDDIAKHWLLTFGRRLSVESITYFTRKEIYWCYVPSIFSKEENVIKVRNIA